jgi:hypothetical protein
MVMPAEKAARKTLAWVRVAVASTMRPTATALSGW